MEGKMPATGYEERGGSSREGGKGRPPAAAASEEESFPDTHQQYAQYHQQQQHQQQHGYYQPVAPYPSDYPGYGPPGYAPAHGVYQYPYPGPSPPPSHEFQHYPAHFAYPPLAPMPPNPHYSLSRFPQISPDSVPPRGKRRPEAAAAAAGRDPSSSSKKARRGAEGTCLWGRCHIGRLAWAVFPLEFLDHFECWDAKDPMNR
jgi:hypothetical protein